MSDICLVSMDNLKRTPYITQYLNCLQDKDYDFLYWNRDLTDDFFGQKRTYAYNHRVRHGEATAGQLLEKLTGYLGFQRFATRILKSNDYKALVCLTGNCAVLLNRVLLKKYLGRFVIDIRDYWHEDSRLYHEIEQRLIRESAITVISSPSYRSFLGVHDFHIMHNSQNLTTEECAIANHEHRQPLHIVCVGAAKNLDYDRKLIRCFSGDERFHLSFRGRGYEKLRESIEKSGAQNVDASGEFDYSKTIDQYKDADIVLSMYGHGSPYWDYALSNKLYFAAQLRLPILVCDGTAMAEIVNQYNLGIAFDPDDKKMKDDIANLFDEEAVARRESGSNSFLKTVESDNTRTIDDLKSFFAS